MTASYDYKQFRVLFVDDEEQTTDLMREYLSDTFEVDTAYSAEEGWELFQKRPDAYSVVVTDQRMPGEQGTELLERIRAARPRTIRILCTAYADIEAAIDAVNKGAIYKYITKPVETPELEVNIMRAMEFFIIQRERDLLMREKLSALQRLMMTDRLISLGIFAAGLNHHLRNGLTAVKTFLDLAPLKLQSENVDLEHLRNPDYWNRFYETAQRSIQHVLGLLKEVQEIPEPPAAPNEDSVRLSELVSAAVEKERAAFERRSISVRQLGGEAPETLGNRAMLSRVFELLVRDEAENVDDGGTVEISFGPVELSGKWEGAQVVIEDSGPGLTAANLQCLFDPFFTRRDKPDQYGLNLLTAFFLVHHHSGSIQVFRSEKGGARFEICLPRDPAEIPAPQGEDAFLQRVMETERVWERKLLGE